MRRPRRAYLQPRTRARPPLRRPAPRSRVRGVGSSGPTGTPAPGRPPRDPRPTPAAASAAAAGAARARDSAPFRRAVTTATRARARAPTEGRAAGPAQLAAPGSPSKRWVPGWPTPSRRLSGSRATRVPTYFRSPTFSVAMALNGVGTSPHPHPPSKCGDQAGPRHP